MSKIINPYTSAQALQIVEEAYKTGATFAASMPLMYAGQQMRAGDRVQLVGGKWDVSLVEHGQLVPTEAYDKAIARKQYNDYMTFTVSKAKHTALVASQELLTAENALRDAQAHVAHARAKAEDAQAHLQEVIANAPKEVH